MNIAPTGYHRNDFANEPPAQRAINIIPCTTAIRARIPPNISRYLNHSGADDSALPANSAANTGVTTKSANNKINEREANKFLFCKFIMVFFDATFQ